MDTGFALTVERNDSGRQLTVSACESTALGDRILLIRVEVAMYPTVCRRMSQDFSGNRCC